MTTPKLEAEIVRLYPDRFPQPLPPDYRPYNPPQLRLSDEDLRYRATFWRCYLIVSALVIIGVTLWAVN